MSSVQARVQAYVARQPRVAWRRRLMKGVLKPIGFGLLWDVRVMGAQHIPQDGPVITMMNHISALDPILTIGAVDQRFVVPMSKVENFQSGALAPFLRSWDAFAVDRGRFDREALVIAVELLRAGQMVLIAPEGTRHPEGLAEAHDGLAYVATKTSAVIVPTAISGAVGWKDSLRRLHRHPVQVTFGRPFRLNVADGTRPSRDQLGIMTREAMYQLALALPDAALRGHYSDVHNATTSTLVFL